MFKPVFLLKRLPRACRIGLGCLVVLLVCWFSGLVGRAFTGVLGATLLPFAVDDILEIRELRVREMPLPPVNGITLTLSSRRTRQLLLLVEPWSITLPPGTLRDGMVLTGSARITSDGTTHTIPIRVAIDDGIGRHPHLSCKYPVDRINHLLEGIFEEKLRTREDYAFGHYDLIYEIDFKSLSLKSMNDDLPHVSNQRRLLLNAKGKTRIYVIENYVNFRTTGKIRRLNGTIDLDFVRNKDGIGVNYNVAINSFKIDFHNVYQWLDRQGSRKLEESLQKALNKKRTKQKVAEIRLPEWFPTDIVLDMEFAPDQG